MMYPIVAAGLALAPAPPAAAMAALIAVGFLVWTNCAPPLS